MQLLKRTHRSKSRGSRGVAKGTDYNCDLGDELSSGDQRFAAFDVVVDESDEIARHQVDQTDSSPLSTGCVHRGQPSEIAVHDTGGSVMVRVPSPVTTESFGERLTRSGCSRVFLA